MSKKIIVHAGFAKTATTSLQQEVLTKLSDLNVIGMPATAFDDILNKIRHTEEIYYDYELVKKEFAALTKDMDDSLPYICSCEGFSFSGFNDRSILAKRVKNLFPEAQIIFTIRETISLVKSLYLHELAKSFSRHEFISFKRWYNRENSVKGSNLIKELDHFSVIREYAKHFGKENIHVLLFEKFTKSQKEFAAEFTSILGVDADECLQLLQSAKHQNERITSLQFWTYRIYLGIMPEFMRKALRAITPKPIRKLLKNLLNSGKGMSVTIPADIEKEIIENFSKSAKNIAAEFGLDLKRYGYKY